MVFASCSVCEWSQSGEFTNFQFSSGWIGSGWTHYLDLTPKLFGLHLNTFWAHVNLIAVAAEWFAKVI